MVKKKILLLVTAVICPGILLSQFVGAVPQNLLSATQGEMKPLIVMQNSAVLENLNPAVKKLDLTGIWESNIGWKYKMVQRDNQVNWTVINKSQTATGVIDISNNEIRVTWSENGSKGVSIGVIIDVDENGKAVFIQWDNGVYFHRQ